MEAYQLRVAEEKQELDSRLEKLQDFLKSEQFATVPAPEQLRLNRQAKIMEDYSQVLGERISAFES